MLEKFVEELLNWLNKINSMIKRAHPDVVEVCLDCRKIIYISGGETTIIADGEVVDGCYDSRKGHDYHITLEYISSIEGSENEITPAIKVLEYILSKAKE